MSEESKKKSSLWLKIKEYIAIQSDYYQVLFVEKVTKIISLLIMVILISGLLLGLLFFSLVALAYLLVPILGKAIAILTVGGLFLLFILFFILFRKVLIVTPILRVIVKIMNGKSNKKKSSENGNN